MTFINQLTDQLKQADVPKLTIAIAKAASQGVIESLLQPLKEGYIHPILIDDQVAIEELLVENQIDRDQVTVIDEADPEQVAFRAVEAVRNGQANALMKGKIGTGTLLKQVVNKETGIRASELLSHVAVLDVPNLERLIAITDGGMVLTPDKEQTKIIIHHAVQVIKALGINQPKVSLLSANEQVIEKLPSSVAAAELIVEHDSDEFVLEGPLSIDISLSPDIAADKGYDGKIQGDADVLVTPDIVAGNMLSKSLLLFGGAMMAGLIIGARVPIILTSRSAKAEEKYASILLAALMMKEVDSDE